jgi:pyruvate/2-oxoglutarate/acetoin dehydrogenase E1 component
MTAVLEALNEALASCLDFDERVYLLGEDLLDPYGGAFKVVRGLSTAYPERVITTPVSEAAIVGMGVGMAMRGLRPVVEIMFGDFLALAADQLINHAAKMRWMSADQARVPLVVRTPMGGGRGYGPTHSQSLEKHFIGVAGLRVVALTALGDPGSLLRRMILEEEDPVLVIEHKLLYASETLPLGSLSELDMAQHGTRYPAYRLRIEGAPPAALTIVAYGYMAELAREALQKLAYEEEIFCELVVPTLLSPLDTESVLESLGQTGRLLVVEEGTRESGWGAELIAQIVESGGCGHGIARLASLDMPIPAAQPLEAAVIPGSDDIVAHARQIVRTKRAI